MSVKVQSSDTRLNYDECSYEEKLKRTVGPGLYKLNEPNNDFNNNGEYLPNDPSIRFQNYGHDLCSMNSAIDDSSELLGLNYKKSNCNTKNYLPNSYKKTSGCDINKMSDRSFFSPQESTRLSNPTISLKETTVNRWQWLHNNPQDFALECFDRVPTNYRMAAKDNHVPLIEVPREDNDVRPNEDNNKINPSDNINNWAKGLATHRYAPGNPDGVMNFQVMCDKQK
tara:strand:- start:5205 stop:5882 length:678 start_codon:yes stop_codon:yes gene_type:complete